MSATTVLTVEQLYQACDVSQFDFNTTDDLGDLSEIIGQTRALDAIQFGIGIRKKGYNIFALGRSGTGKHTVVSQLLTQAASSQNELNDWCYVNNFDHPHKPNVIRLDKGLGQQFCVQMKRLVEELRATIPSLFESEEYRLHIEESNEDIKQRQDALIDKIKEQAQLKDVGLIRTPHGFSFTPMRGGELVSPKDFKTLTDSEKSSYEEVLNDLQQSLEDALDKIQVWHREMREQLRDFNSQVSMAAVGRLIDELRGKHKESNEILTYLDSVQDDVINSVADFCASDEDDSVSLATGKRDAVFRRYEVNVLVDNSETQGAPIIFEDNPTYQNLVGRIEHVSTMGALITDFSLIKAGALHQANHGYLVIDAAQLLQHPYSWEALKRAMCSNEVRIGSLEQTMSLISTVSLEPAAIPLDLKIVLLGDRTLYYLLHELDPEFEELFKVVADFDDQMCRDSASEVLYAQLVATLVKKESLMPFDKKAVGRVIEHSARLAEDASKLTTHMRSICDLVCEADYWAKKEARVFVTAEDVMVAIQGQLKRSGRVQEQIQEHIARDIVLIDTCGSKTGQVNALTVMDVGNASFGSATRITAQVRLGDGDVLDIEREVDLGGPLHSKGVMILSGYLGSHYAREMPLAMAASLVFEQSYGEVEGDSASSAELYALLSAIAGVPLKQGIAVTGSVSQYGEIQAIGGVNEKIEGFFDLCQARGLTGEQGVMIPASNVGDLMLKHEVVDAVSKGLFQVYAVKTIDQGINILTGMDVGERGDDQLYPEDSFNGKVERQLFRFAMIRHEFGESKKDDEEKDNDKQAD